jgi:hypothetical protein
VAGRRVTWCGRDGRFSAAALRAPGGHIAAFGRNSAAFDKGRGGWDRMIIFVPDHGVHIHPADGRETHGEDIPEDMELRHCCGVRPAAGS